MKSIFNVLFYSIILFSALKCPYSLAAKGHKQGPEQKEEHMGERLGKHGKEGLTALGKEAKEGLTVMAKAIDNAVPVIQDALYNGGSGTLATHMPAVQEASAVFGEKFGSASIGMIGTGLTTVRSDIIAMAAATRDGALATAATIKNGAAAAITSPAAPYVAGAAAVGVTAYAGWRVYRKFNPTDEDQLVALVTKSKLLVVQNEIEPLRRQSEQVAAQRALEDCLAKNRHNQERIFYGRPAVCQEKAYMFAMAAGSTEPLDRITELHNELAWK